MWLPIGKIIVTIIFLLTTNAGGAGNPADEIPGYPPNKASNVNYYKDKFDNLKKELDALKKEVEAGAYKPQAMMRGGRVKSVDGCAVRGKTKPPVF